ncbi:hypothetical protein J1614_010766 [Plenodomus biglobosus]|nr:hypothetical protein J1614_010766 [Plenodomus biglobosus]
MSDQETTSPHNNDRPAHFLKEEDTIRLSSPTSGHGATHGSARSPQRFYEQISLQPGASRGTEMARVNAVHGAAFTPSMSPRQSYPDPLQNRPGPQIPRVYRAIAPSPFRAAYTVVQSSAGGSGYTAVQPSLVPPAQTPLHPASPNAQDQLQLKTNPQARSYLNQVAWYTVPGTWAIPQTDNQTAFYVRKLADAIADITAVWDAHDCPWSLVKFQPGGECTDAIYVESIAWLLVSHAVQLHVVGVTGPQFKHASHFKLQDATDMQFSLPQRVEFLARLLRHSKMVASEVMTCQYVDKYVALPFKHLCQFPEFSIVWAGLTLEQRRRELEVEPYPVFARHFTKSEGAQLLAVFQQKTRVLESANVQSSGLRYAGGLLSSGVAGWPVSSPTGVQTAGISSSPSGPSRTQFSNIGWPAAGLFAGSATGTYAGPATSPYAPCAPDTYAGPSAGSNTRSHAGATRTAASPSTGPSAC